MKIIPQQEIALRDSISVWCPTYPRRVSLHQVWAKEDESVLDAIGAANGVAPGYISVYSFPRGHTKNGAVPHIDTLFFDWDIPQSGKYGRPSGPDEADLLSWYADMKPLLSVLSDVAELLIELGHDKYARFALSGHKGVHLFLDFVALRHDLGSIHQYKKGMVAFVADYVERLEAELGYSVDTYLDVDSSDLGRLTRLPNTIHEEATRNFGEPRYCVPVTAEEVVGLTPGEYIRLTQSPRLVPEASRRVTSSVMSTRLSAYIDRASSNVEVNRSFSSYRRTTEEYDRDADTDLSLIGPTRSVQQILSRKPGMWEFRTRSDAFDHGAQSHYFEFAVILEMILHRVPVNLILRYFEDIPRYDEQFTRNRISEIISVGYEFPVSLRKLRTNAPEFAKTAE